jgi:hypothetical protein
MYTGELIDELLKKVEAAERNFFMKVMTAEEIGAAVQDTGAERSSFRTTAVDVREVNR